MWTKYEKQTQTMYSFKNKKCLRNINVPCCKIQKGWIYTMNYPLSSDSHCTRFGNIKQMVDKILNGQR